MSDIDIDGLIGDQRVHRSVYTDERVLDLELDRIFHRTWVYVGHESEIAHAGDYRTSVVGNNSVIVTRDRDGHIHALLNRCRHRGATVCQQATGNANFFRCEYHGWTYQSDGKLVGVPYPDGYGTDFDKADLGLVRVPRVDSYQGLIFASLAESGSPLVEHLGNAVSYIDTWMEQGDGRPLITGGVHQYLYEGNWKLQLENNVDGYHAPVSHKSYFDIAERRGGGKATYLNGSSPSRARSLGNGHVVLDLRDSVGSAYLDRARLATDWDRLTLTLAQQLPPTEYDTALRHLVGMGFNLVIFPNLALNNSNIREFRPLSVNQTLMRDLPMLIDGAPPALNELRLRVYEVFFGPAGFGTPDDLEVWRRVQVGVSNPLDEWVLFNRGSHRVEIDSAGIESGHGTDELVQRSEYEAWARLMREA